MECVVITRLVLPYAIGSVGAKNDASRCGVRPDNLSVRILFGIRVPSNNQFRTILKRDSQKEK
jgi:hypothetical protein